MYRASVVSRDITERKRLEERLAETQKMEALGQLAGGMAHELNNLLHPVINLSKLVKRRLPETYDKSNQHLNMIIDSARKATDVVRSVLLFARKHPSQRKPNIWASLRFASSTLPSVFRERPIPAAAFSNKAR